MPSPPLGNDRKYDFSTKDTPEFREWKNEYNAAKYKQFCFKTIVWVAGLTLAIAALVMAVYGVDSLVNTLEAGRESIGIVKTLAADAAGIVDSVLDQNEDLSRDITGMLKTVNRMCPKVRDPLCEDLSNATTCDVSGVLGPDINDMFQLGIGHFVEGEDSEFVVEIVNAKNGLEDVIDVSRTIDFSAAQLNWALSLSMVMSLLLAILCILILCGLICPEVPKVLQCLRSRFMIPTFCVLVFFAYLFSLVFVTASIATADMCIYKSETENIDERLTTLLTQSETIEEFLGNDPTTQNLVVEFITFYIHQCPIERLPSEISDQLEVLQAGAPLLHQFESIVTDSTERLRDVCGFATNQTQGLIDVADTLQSQLCSLTDILSDVRDFVQCGNWYPLYETTVYEALCYDGTKGFAYVASTQFVIVFMAFVILTFRVAFGDIQVGDEFFDFVSDDESSGSLQRIEDEDEPIDGGYRYYKNLGTKVNALGSVPLQHSNSTSSDSSGQFSETMEDEMDQLRQQQSQKQGQKSFRGMAAAMKLGSRNYNSATSTASGSSSVESNLPQHQLIPPSRNSIYPSRQYRKTVVGKTTALASGGIEVVEEFGEDAKANRVVFIEGYSENGTRDERALDRQDTSATPALLPRNLSTKSRSNNSSRLYSPRAVDSTSLWVKHNDNIEYADSDSDEYESYVGSDYSSGDDWQDYSI